MFMFFKITTVICLNFATMGIGILGGSNTKKHLLSPLQFRLSQFLMCSHGKYATTDLQLFIESA